MHTNINTTSGKRLWLKTLVDLGCIHTGIDKKLVKKKQIKIKLIDKSFKVFSTDKTKNREVTRFAPLELKINRYIEKINIVVIDLNSINIFLEYNYNLEVNWNKGTIQFIKCLREYRTKYQDILFTLKIRKL